MMGEKERDLALGDIEIGGDSSGKEYICLLKCFGLSFYT
jgi:hypothetical protein